MMLDDDPPCSTFSSTTFFSMHGAVRDEGEVTRGAYAGDADMQAGKQARLQSVSQSVIQAGSD